jgi:hypothetical protein
MVDPELPPIPRARNAASEPALTAGIVTAAAAAVLAVAVAFGFHLRPDQAAAIVAAIAALAPIFGALWTRRTAWSPKTVARLAADLKRQTPPAARPIRSPMIPPNPDVS